MNYAKNILETIGNTPLVKLNKLTKDLPCLVLSKYETFNPGNSVKDRMALQMIDELCGNDPVKWQEATEASKKALKMRIKLWDSLLN